MMQEYVSKVPELNAVLEKLYISPNECKYEEICDMLDEIYLTSDGDVNQEFRHEYASISGKMRELNSENTENIKVFSVDNLVANVTELYDYAVQQRKPYIKNLFKLKDHIGLEAGRISDVDSLRWNIENGWKAVDMKIAYTQNLADSFAGEVERSKSILEKVQLNANECTNQIEEYATIVEGLKDTIKEVKKKTEDVQNDSITILGIFASIVLSFTAGMVFTSSVLENIDKASPYRIVGVILLIGMVLTDLIALLLVYVDRVRMLKPGKMEFPKSIKNMNICYICAFAVDFIVWLVLEKLMLLK